ncbi:hypothetical protein FACS1894190_05560 [Spirochaetia bacterium]|nr:hypothetical protein FACS1894190_05560 [Spirochaetia bacterium]
MPPPFGGICYNFCGNYNKYNFVMRGTTGVIMCNAPRISRNYSEAYSGKYDGARFMAAGYHRV